MNTNTFVENYNEDCPVYTQGELSELLDVPNNWDFFLVASRLLLQAGYELSYMPESEDYVVLKLDKELK